ncbi:MAG TPA: hypothetical protein VLU91_07505 [Nitrososphaerales archaeon]|nr:hypothetical protein [Nitrososphaerales archaeon]
MSGLSAPGEFAALSISVDARSCCRGVKAQSTGRRAPKERYRGRTGPKEVRGNAAAGVSDEAP